MRILSDEHLRLQMGIYGRKLVKENFDVREIAKKTSEIYSHFILKKGLKQEVKKYWENEVCGSRYGISENKIEWSKEIEQARYALEPHIPDFADFEEYRGKRILEIGIGAGTDFINWIRNSAVAIGVDFSQTSVKLAKERLDLEGIKTGTFGLCVADAENLPFKNNTFEFVYAWGVLHHTPNTELALKEIYRVLKPGSIIKAMIYHIPSWTGWMLWFRFCLLRLKPWVSTREAIFKYLESPGTKAYSISETKNMFENAKFQEIELKPTLGPGDLLNIYLSKRYQSFIYRLLQLIYPRWLVRFLGSRFGLELLIQAKKY